MEYLTTEDLKQVKVEFKEAKDVVLKEALENPVATILNLGGLSLYEFVDVFWNEIVDDKFKPNWHIPYLCKQLEEVAIRVANNEPKLYDLIINIPPGTTKTLICSVFFPVWCWTQWHWMKFITGSYSDDLALESAEKSRNIMRCDKFKMLYPNVDIKRDKDTKSNYQIVKVVRDRNNRVCRIEPGGGRFSTSVGGTITGFHGHINIWDDPINPKQAVSEALINTANNWIDQSASTRKADKEVTVTIMVMQRLHQNDPSGHVLEKKDKVIRHICLPGEIRNYREQLNPPELAEFYKDELLDPVRLTWKSLKEMEADLGQYGYAGQVGQNPTPPGGGMFKVDHFQMMQTLPGKQHFVTTVRYWDKAATQDGGKRSAGVKMGRLKNGRIVIMDVKKGQWGTDERERIIKETAIADGRDVEVIIEQEPGSGGKDSAAATVKMLAGFVTRKDLPKGDKVYRADPFSVQVNEGNVSLLVGDWNKEFIEEYRYFPFGRFKDQVDAGSGGFSYIVGKRTAGMVT
jgi:predicted phage terminase large subunit-like protein